MTSPISWWPASVNRVKSSQDKIPLPTDSPVGRQSSHKPSGWPILSLKQVCLLVSTKSVSSARATEPQPIHLVASSTRSHLRSVFCYQAQGRPFTYPLIAELWGNLLSLHRIPSTRWQGLGGNTLLLLNERTFLPALGIGSWHLICILLSLILDPHKSLDKPTLTPKCQCLSHQWIFDSGYTIPHCGCPHSGPESSSPVLSLDYGFFYDLRKAQYEVQMLHFFPDWSGLCSELSSKRTILTL